MNDCNSRIKRHQMKNEQKALFTCDDLEINENFKKWEK